MALVGEIVVETVTKEPGLSRPCPTDAIPDMVVDDASLPSVAMRYLVGLLWLNVRESGGGIVCMHFFLSETVTIVATLTKKRVCRTVGPGHRCIPFVSILVGACSIFVVVVEATHTMLP